MNDQEIIIEVAELDGMVPCKNWTPLRLGSAGYYLRKICSHKDHTCFPDIEGHDEFNPKYLASRDAIIPVIEKQRYGVKLLMLDCLIQGKNEPTGITVLTSTPRQLCIALLRATGKWKE